MHNGDFSYYVALDGPQLDGLIGCAGLLRFDWPSREIAFRYYDGVSSGHNVSIAPSGKVGLLGNFSQQHVVIDLDTMEEIGRQSTMAFEPVDYRLRSSTHHLWLDDDRFLCAVGDHLYIFRVSDLSHPEQIGAHGLFNAHELRWDATHRWVLMGDLGPEDRAARQVGVFDLETKKSTVIHLPDTCWHVCVHPSEPIGYAATYSVATENEDYVNWAPAYRREYIFEIDLPAGRIRRTWSSGAEYPIHLNSDLGVYDGKLYVASGGSHTVVEVDLADLASTRVLDCKPSLVERARKAPQELFDLFAAMARRPTISNTHFILQALLVTGGELLDGIYATRVSPDGQYLVTGSRGYNLLTVWDRRTFNKVYSTTLPTYGRALDKRPWGRMLGAYRRLHLGMHHSTMRAR